MIHTLKALWIEHSLTCRTRKRLSVSHSDWESLMSHLHVANAYINLLRHHKYDSVHLKNLQIQYCKGEIIQLKLWVWPKCVCLLKGYKKNACDWLVWVAMSNATTKTVSCHCIYIIMSFKGLVLLIGNQLLWPQIYWMSTVSQFIFSFCSVLRIKPYSDIK